jgi:hypothetical protein
MAAREYRGAGGLLLHLDEPLSDEMAKQVARGHLVPVDGEQPEPEPADDLETPDPVDPDAPAAKPNANSKVDDWRAYAASLGMPEEDAATATKKDCQEYVQVVDDANGSQE